MPMPSYPIYCYAAGCKNLAAYKIAARWSDGQQSELKNYGLACADCVRILFKSAHEKQKAGHLAPGETLEAPGIYHLVRGQRDPNLHRVEDLESEIAYQI